MAFEQGSAAFKNAVAIRRYMLTRASQCWSYNWDAKLQASELKDAVSQAQLKLDRVSVGSLSKMECQDLGFGQWDNESGLYLIPLWLFDFLAYGEELVSINGEKKVVGPNYRDNKSPDYIDNDVRFGCVAWGVVHAL